MTSARTILVDLRAAQFNGDRGIPAYSQSLALELVSRHPRHHWLLLRDHRLPSPGRAAELARHAAWLTVDELDGPAAPAVDVLFTGCFFLPHHRSAADYLVPPAVRRRSPRRLGIVYDLIPLLFPNLYLRRPAVRRQYLAGLRELRRADHLFAISHATRHDTIRHAAVDPLRVHCIYGDIDHEKRLLMARPAAETAGVPGRHGLTGPYCAYVGGDDWRKNIGAAVEAFARFHRRHPRHQLAIVCKLSEVTITRLQDLAASLGLPREAVICTGFVSNADLVGLVRQAEMLVFPSLYEGLGLPVLEAYGCGTPVVGSNTSSVAELVLPELACSPEDPGAIAAAMVRLATDPALREKSLALGHRLASEELGWERAAERVMEHVEGGRRATAARREYAARAPSAGPRLAVVGVLPPADTGIAPYTLRHLEDARWQTTFFDVAPGPRLVPPAGLMASSRFLPAELLPASLARGRHEATIFVLGNSPHHARVLDAIFESRGQPGRRLLWLHEAGLDALLRAWLDDDTERLPAGEPAGAAPDWIRQALAAKPGLPAGLRFLTEHAQLDGLIVNSAACRDLVHVALGPRAGTWPVEVAFLPIEPRPAAAPTPTDDGALRIGSFGHAGDPKRLECVVEAVEILARSRPVQLVIAGWQAGRYCRRTGIDRHRHVEVLDAPDDLWLDAAMRGVDVAVQLRTPSFGESSGVVNQLLAIGTPLVASRIGSFAELPSELVTFVSPAVSPADLATAISRAAGHRPAETARTAFLAARSHESFAARLAAILAGAPPAATGPNTTAACSPAAA